MTQNRKNHNVTAHIIRIQCFPKLWSLLLSHCHLKLSAQETAGKHMEKKTSPLLRRAHGKGEKGSLLAVQGEVKPPLDMPCTQLTPVTHPEILHNALWCDGFGNHNHISLNVEPNENLKEDHHCIREGTALAPWQAESWFSSNLL